MERELARSYALLAMEELRNAKLPAQVPIASAAEYDRRFGAAVTEYMAFLRDHDILTVHGDMDAALRARVGSFSPGPREFFGEVDYRDPELMRTHGYHWFDKARMAREPHPSPIRREALLYNIFNTRTEGHATGWEELMVQAGMFDARPRTRELLYILLAERAARALASSGCRATNTPSNRPRPSPRPTRRAAGFGWMGNSSASSSISISSSPATAPATSSARSRSRSSCAERKQQLGEGFTMRRFMDEFDAAGLIPASLIRWELTGRQPDEIRRMLTP